MGGCLEDLFRTFMYSGSKGRIRNVKEENFTIELNSKDVDVLDFSHPETDRLRAQFLTKALGHFRNPDHAEQVKVIKNEFLSKAKKKEQAIMVAKKIVKSIIN